MSRERAVRSFPVSRRAAMQVGAGMFGLTLGDSLRSSAVQAASGKSARDVSCIFLFLAGGASHFETFDPKLEAATGIRSMWNPISTSVPGTFLCEKLPLTAQLMHKVALVRSWQGTDGRHDGGSQHALNGFPTGPNSSTSQQHYPNLGCMVAALRGTKVTGMPPHVGLPIAGRYTDPPGYLGEAYADFRIKGDPAADDFSLAEDLVVAAQRFETRRNLLGRIEGLSHMQAEATTGLALHDQFHSEAFDTLTSDHLKNAGRLAEEPVELRERYGMNVYGQRVLLARRLVEAGARFVTINQAVQAAKSPLGTGGTWDNHSNIYQAMMDSDGRPGNLPQLDISLSALLEDLDQRGMLETTLVVVMGEFGRTPKINSNGGRDHYPRAGSVLLAGAGISGGVVVGATDRNGVEPSTIPLTPADLAATIYHTLGIDPHWTHFPRVTRPTPISDGQVIRELFA